MRYIYPPAPETLILTSGQAAQTPNADGQMEDITFTPVQFYRMVVETDPKGCVTAKALRMTLRIGEAFAKAAPVVLLEEEVWSHLKAIVEEPTGGYNPALARRLMPWIDAIVGATTVPQVEAARL